METHQRHDTDVSRLHRHTSEIALLTVLTASLAFKGVFSTTIPAFVPVIAVAARTHDGAQGVMLAG